MGWLLWEQLIGEVVEGITSWLEEDSLSCRQIKVGAGGIFQSNVFGCILMSYITPTKERYKYTRQQWHTSPYDQEDSAKFVKNTMQP